VQQFIKTQPILHCYCEAIHLGTHILQKLISDLKSLAKVIVDFHLISDDILEIGLICVKILPVTTLMAVVERKVGLVPP
jgi:hypothetical protein